jgi:oligosaccharyltransferase complex subunit delta (ribophorin II)
LTSSAVTLSPTSSLKLVLTTTEDKSGKKPHQAFLTLREVDTGLEESFQLNVKEGGKGKVDLVCNRRLGSSGYVDQ